jgi:hypothetical protein
VRDVPWFKVDDTFHSHPKARTVSLQAIGLWTMCGSYAMAYKTDGFAHEWFVSGFPAHKRLSRELADAGLWRAGVKDGKSGWYFHDWLDYQPSSDEIEAEREASRARQAAYRKRRREARTGDPEPDEQSASVTPLVTRDVTRESQPPVPSRPVPPCIGIGETPTQSSLSDASDRDDWVVGA